MIKDPKSFLMDFFFPIALIYFGLYFSTIDIVSTNYPKRALSPYDYPHGNPLIYNQHNFNQTEDEVQLFIENGFGADVGEDKLYSALRPIDTNITDHFFEQAAQIDNILFEERLENGPQYGGQFFI